MSNRTAKSTLYTRYPLSRVALYDGVTLIHFLLGGWGIFLGFSDWGAGYLLAAVYLLFAFGQMLVIMPLAVCPSCVYYRQEGGRCISALNLLSRRIAAAGRPVDFRKRARGPLCANNLYLAALIIPIPLILVALPFHFSDLLAAILAILVALLVFRFLILFPKIACARCLAKSKCPNAARMGLNK
jgi:hypothetical protein